MTLHRAFVAALLLSAGAAGAEKPAADPAGYTMSHVYAGLTSVRPIYLQGSGCQLPAGVRVLAPRKLPGGAWDTQDLVYRVTDGMVVRISDWTRLLWATHDPFWSEGLCVGVFDDVDEKGRPAPNAFATDAKHLMLGARMWNKIIGPQARDFESGLIYAVAHEFGHHLQFRAKLTFDPAQPKLAELQADCLAGYLMIFSQKRLPTVQANFYTRAYQLAQELGDDDVDAPDHHGTSAERKRALMMGEAKAISDLMTHDAPKGGEWKPGSKDMLGACGRLYPALEQRAR